MSEKTVTIALSVWEELLKDQKMLEALQAAGVDNWEGYSYALEFFGLKEDS